MGQYFHISEAGSMKEKKRKEKEKQARITCILIVFPPHLPLHSGHPV